MKIAYLITAHDNYAHLKRLVDALCDSQQTIRFYIHIDKKSTFPHQLGNLPNITFVRRCRVSWGGWSQQQSILELMQAARRGNYDHYVLISGVDYPVRPLVHLYEKLRTGDVYINIVAGFHAHKAEGRIKYYHFDGFNRKDTKGLKTRVMYRIEHLVRRFTHKRQYPFTAVYHGSTWWAMPHACLAHVLDFLAINPTYTRFYRTSLCADEGMIHTILGNSPWLERCKPNLTYTDWSNGGASPAAIGAKHIDLFTHQVKFGPGVYGVSEPFFARKFSDQTLPLLDQIDQSLRRAAVAS